MGVMGCLKLLVIRTVEFSLIAALILFMPHLPPDTTFTAQPATTPALPFEGKLALNNRLDKVEHWHEGDIHGPECFAVWKGELYTSVFGGDVVKLTGNHITPIVKFGKPCKGAWQEAICGRPLGLRFDRNGAMYVADAYYGLFKVDVATGEKTKLVSMDDVIEGKKPKLVNSLALASNGDIFWTDSSSDFSLEDGVFSLLGDPTGRLIHYDAATKKNRVLINNIHFANGVWLPDDEDFIVVSETTNSRLIRYYLKGPKKGQQDVFLDGLPGFPDNLQSDGQGGVFVPLVFGRDAEHPNLFQILRPFPLIRKFIARVLGIFEITFATVDRMYPNEICKKAVHSIGHFNSGTAMFLPKRVTILQVSKDGTIVDSLHTMHNLTSISDVAIHNNYLYLGSPFNNYLGRIPLPEVGLAHIKPTASQQQASAQAKPKTQPPPPTTTAAPTTTTTPQPTTTSTTTPKPTTTQAPTTTTPRPTTTTTTRPPPTTTQAPQTTPKTPPPTKAPPTQPPTTQPPKQTEQPKQTPPTTAKPQARAVPVNDGPKKESVRNP